MQNDLHLLSANVRHLGTDINYIVLENLYKQLKDCVDIHFNTHIDSVKNWKMAIALFLVIPAGQVLPASSLLDAVEANGWEIFVNH